MILLGIIAFGANAILMDHVQDLRQQEEYPGRDMVNSAPADLEDLRNLGIEPFVSAIPVIMIDTMDQQLTENEKREVSLAVYDHSSGENDILGNPTAILRGKMKLRGNTDQEKQQYRLNLMKNHSNKEMNYALLGMAEDSRWVLHGPYADRSLLRNYLMYHLSRETMEWAPDCRFFELFLDGKYQGVYLAVEPVGVGRNRLNLSRFSLVSGNSPCILYRDRIGHETLPIETYGNKVGIIQRMLDIRYPDPQFITDTQIKRITEYISSFEKALYGKNFKSPVSGYADYIDSQSFADYFILNELAMNRDLGSLSAYVYKDLNGKLSMCVWDFNRAFDNYRAAQPTDQWCRPDNTWFTRLLEDPSFCKIVNERYQELRAAVLSDAHIDELIADAQKQLGDAADRNFIRWNHSFEGYLLNETEGQHRNPSDYADALNILKNTIHQRLKFMDQSVPKLTGE